MCVCLYKPAGAKMPPLSVLTACHRANPDGMGFCTPTAVYHTLNFFDFVDALAKVSQADPCIMHFRWATHGSVKLSNCHPFVMGRVKFAHNGVLPIDSIKDMTDSEIALKGIIYPAIKQHGFESPEADRIITKIAGSSRFAIMVGTKVELIGRWTLRKGVYYSNLNWLYRLRA